MGAGDCSAYAAATASVDISRGVRAQLGSVLSSCHCLFECLRRHSVLIHNLCKVMQAGSGVPPANVASAQLSIFLPPLRPSPRSSCSSSQSCVPPYSPVSPHSAPLINCGSFSCPKTAWRPPLHPLFVTWDLQGSPFSFLIFSLFLSAAVPCLPPPLPSMPPPPPSSLSL